MKEKVRRDLPAYIRGRLSLDELLAPRRALQLVYEQGPLTQGEAAATLGLSLGACNLHFQRLEYDGLVRSIRLESPGRGPGRPRLHWELVKEANAALGLVFDPPRLFVQLEDFAANVLFREDAGLRSCRRTWEVEERVCLHVGRAMAVVRSSGLQLRMAFAALPGILAPRTGAVKRAVNFPVLEGLSVSELLPAKFGIPTIANSLGAAYYYGEAVDVPADRTAMVLYWDLGLGFAFGRNRQLLTVHGGEEGGRIISELGHISIAADGPLCHCGERGCLEAYAGGWVLLQQFAGQGVRNLEDLVRLAATGHEELGRTVQAIGLLLGRSLANPIQMFGVSEVRVTGPLAPLFQLGRGAFMAGLADIVGARSAAVTVSIAADPTDRLLAGATRAARRAFLYPDEFNRLSHLSVTLQGQRLAEG